MDIADAGLVCVYAVKGVKDELSNVEQFRFSYPNWSDEQKYLDMRTPSMMAGSLLYINKSLDAMGTRVSPRFSRHDTLPEGKKRELKASAPRDEVI